MIKVLLTFQIFNMVFLYVTDYRLMNEFIEAIGEFKMKTQRILNLSPVSKHFIFIIFVYKKKNGL